MTPPHSYLLLRSVNLGVTYRLYGVVERSQVLQPQNWLVLNYFAEKNASKKIISEDINDTLKKLHLFLKWTLQCL